MNFTVYITVRLHWSFNCNFTSIYNSAESGSNSEGNITILALLTDLIDCEEY